jgi:hypothetical protein
MNGCSQFQSKFSEYLDGRMTGVQMQSLDTHIQSCADCSAEWNSLRQMQGCLSNLGPVAQPVDLPLRIRVAVSHEIARRSRSPLQSVALAWRNTVGPFMLQAAAGFASAVLLIGTVAVLVGIVATPQSAQAGDEPLGAASAPRLIDSITGTGDNDMAALPGPVVVEAYVDNSGRVYDFNIVSGPNDAATRSEVENMLLSDRFEPAKFWGQPVRGVAVLSFSGVSVRG